MPAMLLATAAALAAVVAGPDTVPDRAEPGARRDLVPVAASPIVRVHADDTTSAAAVFLALGAELRLDAASPAGHGKAAAGAPAELRVTKRTDGLTPLLAARVGSGRRLAAVTVELPGATDTLRVRLADAVVVAERIVFPAVAPELEGQRVAQELAVSQVAADREEAARQLAEAEAIAEVEARDRRKLVPANALARARDQVRLLDLRLAAARRQLALLEERLARAAAPTEEVTVRAERAEVLAAPAP